MRKVQIKYSEVTTSSSMSLPSSGYSRKLFSFLSLPLALYNNSNNHTHKNITLQCDCRKSYLYFYDFRAIYKYSLYNHTRNIFTYVSLFLVCTESIRSHLGWFLHLVHPIQSPCSSFGSHLEGPKSQHIWMHLLCTCA